MVVLLIQRLYGEAIKTRYGYFNAEVIASEAEQTQTVEELEN